MPVSIKIQQKNEELSVKQQAREQQTREYTRCRQGRAVFTPKSRPSPLLKTRRAVRRSGVLLLTVNYLVVPGGSRRED